jgi:hypothetical protein
MVAKWKRGLLMRKNEHRYFSVFSVTSADLLQTTRCEMSHPSLQTFEHKKKLQFGLSTPCINNILIQFQAHASFLQSLTASAPSLPGMIKRPIVIRKAHSYNQFIYRVALHTNLLAFLTCTYPSPLLFRLYVFRVHRPSGCGFGKPIYRLPPHFFVSLRPLLSARCRG